MPFYIKDPSLAIQLELELQQIAVILPDIYLAGESFIADVNNAYHFIFCMFYPYLDPDRAAETALLQQQYFEDAIRNFEKNQITDLGKIDFQPDVYLQSNGTITGGKLNNANIHVSWLNTTPQDALLCSAQYYYCFKTQSKIFKNKKYYDQFNKKILYSSLWSSLFAHLSYASRTNTVSKPFTTKVKNTINFLFKIYINHLARGWQLDDRDKEILERYFADNNWKTYLCESFQKEMGDQNNNNKFDLIGALKLATNTQSLKTNIDNNVTFTHLTTQTTDDKNKSQQNQECNQQQYVSEDEGEKKQQNNISQNHRQAKKAIQKKSKNNIKSVLAIKTQDNSHHQDARPKDEEKKQISSLENDHPNQVNITKNVKSTNKKPLRQGAHPQQKNLIIRKSTAARADKTVWSTIKALMKWAYEHPMYAFTALFAIIAMMQMRPTRSNVEEKTNLCFAHYERIGGVGNFNDAKVLVILNNNSYNSHIDEPTASCLNFYKAQTLLQKNVPLGHKTNCDGNECIGWDSISTERILQEKKYLFEKLAFNNINKIYNENMLDHVFFQNFLRNYHAFLREEQLLSETKYGFSEVLIKTTIDYTRSEKQDWYRTTIIMIKHVEFFIDKEIRSTQDLESLYKQYQKHFSPLKEPQSDNDLEKRTKTMCHALKKYRLSSDKLAILADAYVYNNGVKNRCHKDFGSYMTLGLK